MSDVIDLVILYMLYMGSAGNQDQVQFRDKSHKHNIDIIRTGCNSATPHAARIGARGRPSGGPGGGWDWEYKYRFIHCRLLHLLVNVNNAYF